ncbi:MAG: hypothetical protein J6U20_09855 [Fibrobacter sp.]|nr:hypothetical protein [Fibrobacter sp.]
MKMSEILSIGELLDIGGGGGGGDRDRVFTLGQIRDLFGSLRRRLCRLLYGVGGVANGYNRY